MTVKELLNKRRNKTLTLINKNIESLEEYVYLSNINIYSEDYDYYEATCSKYSDEEVKSFDFFIGLNDEIIMNIEI